LRLLIIGGERALNERLDEWQQFSKGKAELINAYGLTETTIASLIYRTSAVSRGTREVPIGMPIANNTAYILDGNLQMVPAGVIGELYVGGEGVARGYLRRPDLTATKFIPDPFARGAGDRLYRTG